MRQCYILIPAAAKATAETFARSGAGWRNGADAFAAGCSPSGLAPATHHLCGVNVPAEVAQRITTWSIEALADVLEVNDDGRDHLTPWLNKRGLKLIGMTPAGRGAA